MNVVTKKYRAELPGQSIGPNMVSLYYQAVPEHCRLLAKARRDVSFGSYLEKCVYIRELGSLKALGIAEDPAFNDFISEIRGMVEENPWIEERNLNLGRNWDVLHYLMSDKRRGEDTNGYSDWMERAINGGDVIHEDVKTGSGAAIKYLSPSEVSHISSELSKFPAELLSKNWHPKKLKDSNVYRPIVLDEAQFFDDICRDLMRLQTFYTVVSKYGEGVLTLAI